MRKFSAAFALLCVGLSTCSVFAQGQFAPSKEDVQTLKKAQKEYTVAQKLYKLHPSSSSKKAYIVATDRYAMTSMMSGALEPKVKYRQALNLYREVLKIDPTNNEAKTNSDLIISIYKSMHRPIPH